MPTSANHDIPTPSSNDYPQVADHLMAMAEQIDSELDAIAPQQIHGVSAGRMLTTSSTGSVTSRAISGDATIDNTGVLTIGGIKVDTPDLKDSAVKVAKIRNGVVTKQKMAPWFNPFSVTISGTYPNGSFGYALVKHELGHTNYTALVTCQGLQPMDVAWFKGSYVGYDQEYNLVVRFQNNTGSSVANPALSVLVMNLS